MKCEVCGHKIPFGERSCPNCGFQVENRIIIPKDINEEPEIQELNLKEKAEVVFLKSSTIKADKLLKGFLCFILVAVISAGIEIITGLNFSSQTDFEQVLEENQDDNYSTVFLATLYRDEITGEFEKLGVESVYTQEEVTSYEDGLEAICQVVGNYNNNEYTISFTIKQGIRSEYYLVVTDEIGGDLDEFPIPELDDFSALMGYESIVEELDKIREYNPRVGYEYENDRIIAYEKYIDDYYDIYYMIAANGYKLY